MRTCRKIEQALVCSAFVAALSACRKEPAPRAEAAVAATAISSSIATAASATSLSALLVSRDAGATAAFGAPVHTRQRAALAPRAGERIPIPAGRFYAGSLPGDE